MTIKLGYQIPNFSYPDGDPAKVFPTVVAQAQEAEASGFDTVLVMDHFYQLPGIGTPDQPMLESYTLLAALSGATSRVQLSTLVTGNTYRQPTHLAKTVTTLDVVSGGRAVLGIGAGWFEREHHDLGFEFGTFTDRFERLEEALNIIKPMLEGAEPTFKGKWYEANTAMNNPRVRPTIPIMLGGSGEQKTFRLAARFADHMNIICSLDDLARKVTVLKERCEEIDRDPATLPTTYLASVRLTDSDAETKTVTDSLPEAMRARAFIGTPDQVAEKLQEKVLGAGVTGLTFNMVADGHEPGKVTAAGQALAPLVGLA